MNKNEKEQNKFVENEGINIEKLLTNKNPSKPKNTMVTNGAPDAKERMVGLKFNSPGNRWIFKIC